MRHRHDPDAEARGTRRQRIVVTPLAEGVEDLQVEYGIDANGDGTPDRYLVAPDPALGAGFGEWSNVMAVRLYLLARSIDVEPATRTPPEASTWVQRATRSHPPMATSVCC